MKRIALISFLYLTVIINDVTLATNQDRYCYATDDDPYVKYSTKTAYDLVRGRKIQAIPSCKPVFVWSSIRHSTRYPSVNRIEAMKKLDDLRKRIHENHYTDNNGQLCEKDLQSLKNWSYSLTPAYANKLSTQGKDDLRFFAKRFKSQFASLFENLHSTERFLFFNDGTERTTESTEAFMDGLFGPDVPKRYTNYTLLRGIDICPTWQSNVARNPEMRKEYERFQASHFMQDTIYDISRRLGFEFNLSLSIVEVMYDSCRYEKAWYIASRPAFCSAFSKDNLKVMEYVEDLKYYYKFGYGIELNKHLACPVATDLVQYFSDVAEDRNDTSKPLAVFDIYHSSVHLSLLSLLKFKEDLEPLRSDNYATMANREFATSVINPFTANLVAAFYKCTEGEQNRVIFYLNEEVVRYPGCDGLCSWKSFYEKMKPVIEKCHFDYCYSSASTIVFEMKIWLLTVTLFLAYFVF